MNEVDGDLRQFKKPLKSLMEHHRHLGAPTYKKY
jgi:hypothetical protein